jgi:S1-C subfamily serine protease
MTWLDWLILTATLLLAGSGFFRGFIVGALSLAGFAVGAVVGTRLAGTLLPAGSASPYAPAFGLLGALLAGGVLATGLEGIGLRIRMMTSRVPLLGFADGVLGAMLSACVALGIFWILAAVALEAPGGESLRRDIQRSAILQRLNALLPPSGPILHALARFDPLPAISGPQPGVSAPPPAIANEPAIRAATASVVRVLGTACGLGIEGSGWVAAPGIVVTNAHVVAGEQDTTVEVHGSGPALAATAILFDPHNDVAVLRVPGVGEPPLPLAADPQDGQAGAIVGYPQDGPLDAQPGRIGQTQSTLTQDAYGNGPVSRLITPLRGLVRPGNSGGPIIDSHGQVITTVFAATVGSQEHGGYGVPNSVVAGDLDRAQQGAGAVGTGSCAG